ncbi:RHS repeat-associated core domain-containing protein [Longimicrobium terrae]|nr:RHS repeat-associated core domain-containing protein [Longimicrobium terrae]NNC28350.1 RHS repeat-associated core domain-containing protein [Longimicrobium terrae]
MPPGNRSSGLGSLVHNKRDLSGNLYMRNRYYDAQAGRFSQEDPIGLAGGLNAYGFAAGDPVSYSDPYGLCADRLYKRRGLLGLFGVGEKTCPGGLSHQEYDITFAALNTLVPGSETTRLFHMLDHGGIRRVERTWRGRPAEADYKRGRINVMYGFFDGKQPGSLTGYNTPGERGWVLGHELGHIFQYETGKLVQHADNPAIPSNRAYILGLFRDQSQNGENALLQGDANLVGCRIARQPGLWGPHVC